MSTPSKRFVPTFRALQAQLARALQMRALKPPRNSRYATTQTGYYFAARYLRARGWTIEAALLLLCGPAACDRFHYRGMQ